MDESLVADCLCLESHERISCTVTTNSPKFLLVGFSIILIAIVALFFLLKRAQLTESSSNLAVPFAESGSGEAVSSYQRELEQLLQSRGYNDLLERVRSDQITPADFELLLKMDDLKGKMIKEPKLEKRTKYPPEDAKGLEMWRWWRAMQAADSQFTYKRQVAFYGKVLDDQGIAIPNAAIVATIQGPNGLKDLKVSSDSSGLFQIKGERGKYVRIEMDKPGYGRGPNSYGTFEYAEFFSERFHQADPSNPVVFVLPRLVP